MAAVGAVLAALLQGPASVYAATNPVRPPASHSPAPVKLPASSGEPAPMQPKRLQVGEQPSLRTQHSATRYNADHTLTTTTSIDPVNYRARNGSWQPIDNALVSGKQKGYAYQNGANSFQTLFKSQLGDDYLSLVVGGQVVTMTLQGSSKAQAATKGSTIRYPGALPSVDATYNVLGNGLEEVLTLEDAQAPASFQFLLKARQSTAASRQPDGSWSFVLPGHSGSSFLLRAPMAYDSGSRGGDPQHPHSEMSVKQGKDGFEVMLSLDQSWLSDSSRKFPVYLDPTFTIQPDSADATFDNRCSTCTGATYSGLLYIGTDSSHAYRSAIQFDLRAIPAGASITSSSLGLYGNGCLFACNSSLQLDVHRMTAPWSPASQTQQIQFDPTVLSSIQDGSATPWLTWSITSTVANWLSGAQPNYGLYVQLSGDSKLKQGGQEVAAMSFSNQAAAPVLSVTYSGDAVQLDQPSTLHANGAEVNWSQYTGPSGAPFQQYQVHRSLTPGFTPSASTLLTTISDLTTTGFHDTTAAPGGTFYYAVVANTSKSNEIKVTLPADGQSSITLPATGNYGDDTYIDSNGGCDNWGLDTHLWVGPSITGPLRSLLRFDLHALPANATNVTANLRFWTLGVGSIPLTLHAYPVTASWSEGTGGGSCTGDGATWTERTGGVAWTAQGGDFDASTPSSQVSFPSNVFDLWNTFDVSAIVSKWANGQLPNDGFLIKADNETYQSNPNLGESVEFASGDYILLPGAPLPGDTPLLQVTYTDGSHATPPAVSVSAPAPGATVSGSSVTLSAAASSPGRLSEVQLFVDGTSVGTASQAPWQVTWNSASVGNGSHTITATATDSAGNSATSAGTAVTVNNFPSPTTAITSPANNASGLTGTVSVSTSNTVAGGLSISKVELYVDGALAATSTASPWSLSWNTLDPTMPSFDGSHTLVSKVYDSSGLIASSSPVTVTVANTAGTQDQASFDPTASVVPQAMSYDPNASTQLTYPVNVSMKNTSGQTWSGVTLRYRWYLAGSSTSFADSADVTSLSLAPGGSQTTQVNVTPPTLTAGMDQARFTLRFDLVDSSGSTPAFLADRGNPPLDNPVIVNKVLSVNLGLEHFWQFTSQPVGAGITQMTNIANGNSVLSLTPLSEPGRGVSTVVDLTYNSLEEHSDSPAGNNWSLSMSGLTRFGDPIDVHPNNADSIAGRSNKFINFVDGTGRLLTFTGVTGSDGVTFWEEPPGVHLYLRQVSTDTSLQGRFWAITRPDRVTFFYDSQGFPTAVSDKNGNTLTYTLTAVQPGDDPGGPKFHVTQVTDAAGQGSNPAPNRSFNITYFTKATARKPQIRGKIASITDHLFDPNNAGVGRELDFAYYDDGNLLRITDKGGHNADGSSLADRSMVFTYTTSDGSGPAISDPNARVNPDPKTPNESTKIFSVRDYNGHETTFAYNGPTSSIDRWKLASVTDRANNTTNFSYDDVNLVTTVAEPTPSGQTARTYKYAYDVQGRPTQITDPLGGTTSFQWSPDNAVTQLTEPNNATRNFTYNDNGDPLDILDQLGDHTALTYENVAADANDVPAHWNPAGGANGTGRTIPHVSQLSTKQDPNAVKAASGDKWAFKYDANGNLKQVFEPLFPNNPASNDYNADGTLADTKDFLGNQTTYLTYDANGLPTKIADATDSPTSPTHPLQLSYDAAGRTLFVQDENHASFTGGTPANYQTQFFYDTFGRVGRQTTPKSTSLNLGTLVESDTTYDPNDNVRSVVAPHCVPVGGCTNETATSNAGIGDTSTTAYDVMNRKVLNTDPSNNQTAYAYDAAGRLSQVTLPLGVLNGTPNNTRTLSYGYDALDRTIVQTQNHVNPDNSVSALNTLACYDTVGNMVSVTQPKAGLSSLSCPGTTSTPFTTVYSYDKAHHLTGSTDADGHASSFTYDLNGNRVSATDANNDTTTFSYDALNRPTQTCQPFLGTAPLVCQPSTSPHPVISQTVYDADGNVVQSVSPRAVDCAQVSQCAQSNPNAYITTNHYDQLNRLIRQDLPVDGTTVGKTLYYIHRSYDFNGNLLSVSLPATQSDPTQVPVGLKTVSTYFDAGWIASEQVGVDTRIHYDYNGKGQETLRVPDSKSGGLDVNNEVFWNYQPNGLLANRKDQQGQPVNYTYDADGNLTFARDASGLTDQSQTAVDTVNAYNDLDRLVRSDLKTEAQNVLNWTFSSFAYDLNGNVTDLDQNGLEQNGSNNLPNGVVVKDGHKLHSDYDNANWLTDQLDSTLNQRVVNTFWPIGLEKSREIDQSNGSGGWNLTQQTSWSYFANGKLSGLATVVPSKAPCQAPCSATTTIENHTVSYLDTNPNYANTAGVYVDGNRTQDVYSLRPGSGGSSNCFPGSCTATYSYDPQDRLVGTNDGHGNTTTYMLDGPGNIHQQTTVNASGTTTINNFYDPNNVNHLQKSVNGTQTLLYWYDDLGRQQCVTDANGSQANCGPSDNTPASTDLISDNRYDYLDRLTTYRAFSGGNRTDDATYIYDALNRQVQETEQHPTLNGDTHITTFSYLGMGGQDVEEQQTSKNTGSTLSIKDFTYDINGHRLSMTCNPCTNGQGGPTTYTYGYDVHGSVSQLVDPNGNTTASYGYTPYGQSDGTLSQGDTSQTTQLNPFRYSAKRLDTGSGTLDMGVRRFGPDTAHFLTPDFFYGSLSNLGLSIDPITGNRYDLAGGNPISFKEWDGHVALADGGGGAATTPAPSQTPSGPGDRCGGCEDVGSGSAASGSSTGGGAAANDIVNRCITTLNCTVQDFDSMTVAQRQQWAKQFQDTYGARGNFKGWFTNIDSVLQFAKEHSLIEPGKNWFSDVDAGILQGIQDGYAESIRTRTSSENPGAAKWAAFFEYRLQPGARDDVSRHLWGPAEQASTDYGQQVAARNDRQAPLKEFNNFIGLGNVYRWSVASTADIPVVGGLFDPRNQQGASVAVEIGWAVTPPYVVRTVPRPFI
jgi:RHS repeat-associated protein